MNNNLHIHVGIERTSLNYDIHNLNRRFKEEADSDIERLQDMVNELNVQIVANVLGMHDFPEHRLGERINGSWAIGYFTRRIKEASDRLKSVAGLKGKDLYDFEGIVYDFTKRLTLVMLEAGKIQRGW